MLRILLFLLSLGLVIYTVVDALQHPDEKPYGLHRVLWVVIMVFVPPVGSLVWLAMRYVKGTGQQARPTVVAPDDDPDYLRWLAERERLRKQREQDGKDGSGR